MFDKVYSSNSYWLELLPYAFYILLLSVEKPYQFLLHHNFLLDTKHSHLPPHIQYILDYSVQCDLA